YSDLRDLHSFPTRRSSDLQRDPHPDAAHHPGRAARRGPRPAGLRPRGNRRDRSSLKKENPMKTATKRHQMFIGGRWVDSTGGEVQEVKNPATGEPVATVPKGTAEDVDRAVKAARKAYDEVWLDSTPRERSEHLLKLADAIEAHGEELARIESDNVGKPL